MPTPSTSVRDLPFRPHRRSRDSADPVRKGGIFGALSDEWLRLCAMPAMNRTLTRWANREPCLADMNSLGEVVDRIDAADPEETDRLLLALIRLGSGGQQLAARVVLQAMLPKLSRITTSTEFSTTITAGLTEGNLSLDDRRQAVVATFWEVLAGYPADRRTRRVAANLALDTLQHLTKAHRSRRSGRLPMEFPTDSDHELNSSPAGRANGSLGSAQVAADHAESVGILTDDADLLEVIAWAIDVRAISAGDAALLVRVYAPAPGQARGSAASAAEMDLTPAALRKRCSRARRRITEAVRADAEGRSLPTPPDGLNPAVSRRAANRARHCPSPQPRQHPGVGPPGGGLALADRADGGLESIPPDRGCV